ncbi:hypothetical protein ACP70R_012359 [Stipagrostis hirtigluma subsp. patula]
MSLHYAGEAVEKYVKEASTGGMLRILKSLVTSSF